MDFTKFETLSIKSHPELDEKWVQARIAEDPSILGLGDVVLKDKERPQPKAGRLDLLLQDAEANRRYEVEVQLGYHSNNRILGHRASSIPTVRAHSRHRCGRHHQPIFERDQPF